MVLQLSWVSARVAAVLYDSRSIHLAESDCAGVLVILYNWLQFGNSLVTTLDNQRFGVPTHDAPNHLRRCLWCLGWNSRSAVEACGIACTSSMSLPGVWSHVCAQHDPVKSTCPAGNILPKRGWSLPLRHHRPSSSPRRSGSCVLVNSQARSTALAATVTADTVRTDQALVSSPLPTADDRLRQLEASYKAQSAAELLHVEMQPRGLDASSDTHFETSWQAQAEASTSGRSSPHSSASFVARLCSRKPNSRSHRRSSRVCAASARRNQSQDQGVERTPQSTPGCPDTQFCKVIADRLKKEKQTRRISRSEHCTFITRTAHIAT